MSTLGDIMNTSGDVQHIGGYHEYIRVFNINQRLLSTCSPHRIIISPDVLNIPRCTLKISPDVIMVSLRCTEHILYMVKITLVCSRCFAKSFACF